jgi:hypothetical protein
MGRQSASTIAPSEAKATIVCRLRHRAGKSPTAGEVELENVSQKAIEIEVTMHPLQYLDLVITDANGKLVEASPYGNIFSPREVSYVFRLAPGEKYTHNVSLLGNVPQEKQAPGKYSVKAFYEYEGLMAVSDPVEVEICEQAEKKL